MTVSVEMLHRLLICDADAGRLTWRARTPDLFKDGYRSAAGNCANWNARFAGRPAFTFSDGTGHCQGALFNKRYFGHRVIWAMHTGAWPTEQIDHIDGNPRNNCISNLREATQAQNARNRRSLDRSSSSYVGVCWDKLTQKWRAQIGTEGRNKHIGLFEDEAAAARAYDLAARQHHGDFARLNFPEVAA